MARCVHLYVEQLTLDGDVANVCARCGKTMPSPPTATEDSSSSLEDWLQQRRDLPA